MLYGQPHNILIWQAWSAFLAEGIDYVCQGLKLTPASKTNRRFNERVHDMVEKAGAIILSQPSVNQQTVSSPMAKYHTANPQWHLMGSGYAEPLKGRWAHGATAPHYGNPVKNLYLMYLKATILFSATFSSARDPFARTEIHRMSQNSSSPSRFLNTVCIQCTYTAPCVGCIGSITDSLHCLAQITFN